MSTYVIKVELAVTYKLLSQNGIMYLYVLFWVYLQSAQISFTKQKLLHRFTDKNGILMHSENCNISISGIEGVVFSTLFQLKGR